MITAMGTSRQSQIDEALKLLLDEGADELDQEDAVHELEHWDLGLEALRVLEPVLCTRRPWRLWQRRLVLHYPGIVPVERYIALLRDENADHQVWAMESAHIWARHQPEAQACIGAAFLAVSLPEEANIDLRARYHLERWRWTEEAQELEAFVAIVANHELASLSSLEELMSSAEHQAIAEVLERDHGLYSPALPPLPRPLRQVTVRWRAGRVSLEEPQALRRFSSEYGERSLRELLAELRSTSTLTLSGSFSFDEERAMRGQLEELGLLLEPRIPPTDEELRQEDAWCARWERGREDRRVSRGG